MISMPQMNPEKQLIATKLVLREVEINTPGRKPTGGKYEHPAKDKIDYANPILKIFKGTHWTNRMYFGS